jgi:hypothetical protein
LRELGRSLADVAAFMHEVELEQGLSTQRADQRGIERLRALALRMQKGEVRLDQTERICLFADLMNFRMLPQIIQVLPRTRKK